MRTMRLLLCLILVVGGSTLSRLAAADQLTIKLPGRHPDYSFEAEPHLMVVPFGRLETGAGFRGTVQIVDNGFVSAINNSVGIGFGADITNRGTYVPVVMQWNFWLSQNWSVFGEPGISLGMGRHRLRPAIWAGGRFRLTDTITLTLRAGSPDLTFGVSFLI